MKRKIQMPIVICLAALVTLVSTGCGEKVTSAKSNFNSVDSSLIDGIRYNSVTKNLTIKFDSGEVYDYHMVPGATYERLMKSQSKGKFFHAEIKDSFEFTQQSKK